MPPRTVSAQVRCHASVAQNQIRPFIGVELTICKARPHPQVTAVFWPQADPLTSQGGNRRRLWIECP